MCGIIGITGHKDALPILLESLKRLEYRGYDSAGVAGIADQRIWVRRKKGKIRDLERLLQEDPPPPVYTAIGHTRWATHGKPSDENAHPHFTERVAVVHNGIIENYLELKQTLQAEGVRFKSETDTEVIVHLLDRALREGADLQKAVLQVVHKLRGTFALGIISPLFPELLVGVRKGSPLVVGLSPETLFISSDIPALIPLTTEVIPLDDEEIAILKPRRVRITDFSGQSREKPIVHISWDPVSAEKGGFQHFMEKEIYEQSRAVADTLLGRLREDEEGVYLETVEDAFLRDVEFVVLVACGTSYHAGLLARHWLQHFARLPAVAEVSSEFREADLVLPENTLIVAISQSGETIDTLFAVQREEVRPHRLLAITNIAASSLARVADAVLTTHAGPEIGVAATKTFTAQLAALLLLALRLAQLRGTVKEEFLRTFLRRLRGIPLLISQTLDGPLPERVRQLARQIYRAQHALYLGRGLNEAIAREGALKLKEIGYIHAEAYPAGEMKHGPIALVEPDLIPVFVGPEDPWFPKLAGNVQEVRARNAQPILVSTEGHPPLEGVAYELLVPRVDPYLSPFLTILPLQLLAYEVAVLRGNDVDQPRNLAKTVTVE